MARDRKERGPLTPKKRKTLFVVDGATQTIPRRVADELGLVVDLAGADREVNLDVIEGDWGSYASRYGFGLIRCKVHKDYLSAADFKNSARFQMRMETTATVYVDTKGVADEAVEMAAKLRAELGADLDEP